MTYPLACEGCYTFREVTEENYLHPGSETKCMARRAPNCPCTLCICKVTCSYKIRCLDFLVTIVKYKADTDPMRFIKDEVPDLAPIVLKRVYEPTNMEEQSNEVCKKVVQWQNFESE